MTQIRPAAVAGHFYPDNRTELLELLASCMHAKKTQSDISNIKAMIAPHAGYIYSGPVAASVYQYLSTMEDTIKRVLLLGPAHRVFVKSMALSSASHFETPLGRIPLDIEAQTALLSGKDCLTSDDAHAREHSLEVHLPFLQYLLGDFKLIPIVVGKANKQVIADVIAPYWDDEETLIIVSSDLSHFHDYATAQRIDQTTTESIESFATEKIGPQQACGCYPLNGLLQHAKQSSATVKTLDVRNSGDTAGSHDRVVGYGAYVIC